MVGVKPLRIDVLTGIDGVAFEEARIRVASTVGKLPSSAAGRTKDLLDLAELSRRSKKP
jgi:hypothetical protein